MRRRAKRLRGILPVGRHVGVEAVTETRFGRFLTAKVTAMGGSKTKCRVGTVYIGICIAEAPAPQAARMAA